MLNLGFVNFPALFTKRLALRQLNAADAEQVHALRSSEEVNQFLDRAPSTCTEDALAHIRKIEDLAEQKKSLYWAINLTGKPDLIGGIGFWNFAEADNTIELGYELLPHYQGKGLMTEAIAAAIAFAFEQMKAETITAFTSPDNLKSIHLLGKIGFERDNGFYANKQEDLDGMVIYVLKKDKLAPAFQ